MPVLLDRTDFRAWLNGADGPELLRPATDDRLRMWPAFSRINKTGSGGDDAVLIDEVAARQSSGKPHASLPRLVD